MDNEERFNVHANELEKNEFQLPLGTILEIQNSKSMIMIVGYKGMAQNLENRIFDYIGCLYPGGINNNNGLLLFNQNQINKIYSVGYIQENLENKIK